MLYHPAISPAHSFCLEAPFLKKWNLGLESGSTERYKERRNGILQNDCCQGSTHMQGTAKLYGKAPVAATHSEGHSLSVHPRVGKHVRNLAPSCTVLGCKQVQPLWKAIWQFLSKFLNVCFML